MTPIQQMYLGVGAKKKTYLEDVFSNYLYKGTNGANTISNGINNSGEEGMLWVKARNSARNHMIFDTIRGVNKKLSTNLDESEDNQTPLNQTFTSSGFTWNNSYTDVNDTNVTYMSQNFRKAPGFFDVVTWTGNGTARDIPHNLKSIPGMILIKSTSNAENWVVYHADRGNTKYLTLNTSGVESTSSTDGNYANIWNNQSPTSTDFTIGTHSLVNENNWTYVAYVFAGGKSTAATARSLILDGTGDYLSATSSDFAFGTGDFTIEGWFNKDDDTQGGFWDISTTSGGLGSGTAPACAWTGGDWQMYGGGDNTASKPGLVPKTWFHVAQVRASGVTTMYVNGIPVITKTDTANYTGTHLAIGGYYSTSYLHEGKISNFRIVKGTAVYTSAFRPPTAPLTNITNTKILCCNDSSTTGKTVGPTITANGDPTASIDSPFDDPAGFKFGEGEEGIIKCGIYEGNGSATGPEINLGWEPQWVLIKRTSGTEDWVQLDNMRGINTDGNDPSLRPNTTAQEGQASRNWMNLTPTGFQLKSNPTHTNGDGDSYIYLAIRRSDGYIGKPAEAGTDVFALDTGSATTTIPNMDSGFLVDFAIRRAPAQYASNYATARITGGDYLTTDGNGAHSDTTDFAWDSNVGWEKSGFGTNTQSWMWKRHAGFDVQTYKGNNKARSIPHNLSKPPEMIWIKNRDSTYSWQVYHSGLNNGSNPEKYFLKLEDTMAQFGPNTALWNDTPPTSTHFSVATWAESNENAKDFLALLFASVEGVSKVGKFSGVSSNANLTIDLGFVPRLFIHKRVDSGSGSESHWYIWDSLRGMGSSGTEKPLFLNNNTAEGSAFDYVATTTAGTGGITLTGGVTTEFLGNDPSNHKYIYYAHA